MDSANLETISIEPICLDTVRSLHSTVVSLRTALEGSKNELKELKRKYKKHTHCTSYHDIIEKLSLENHVLKCKIVNSYESENKLGKQNINSQATAEILKNNKTVEAYDESSKIEKDIQTYSEEKEESPEVTEGLLKNDEHLISENNDNIRPKNEKDSFYKNVTCHAYKTKFQLSSKFDVKIKFGTPLSHSTSDSDSDASSKKCTNRANIDKCFENEIKKSNIAQTEENCTNIKTKSENNLDMAFPSGHDDKSKTDKFDVQVKMVSEDNFTVTDSVEATEKPNTLQLDLEDLSVRSVSEGDNSVFTEGCATPEDTNYNIGSNPKVEQENISGNESEEVDDIELIFTADESKDMSNLQDDFVPIKDSEHWNQSASTHSTPVLIKFHTIDSDFQSEGDKNSGNSPISMEDQLKIKRVSLPNDKEIRRVAFNAKNTLELPARGILKSCNKSDNMLYKKSPNDSNRQLDSVESLSGEYTRGLSFDNTKSSSFEIGSGSDVFPREESLDNFQNSNYLGYRFSVFGGRDISKCGISEDDLANSLSGRRFTCPNPFQYRPYRGYTRATAARAPVPRPVLRAPPAVRCESAAQTDVSALPPRWSSDGHLAYKMGACAPPVLPPRPVAPRRLTAADVRRPSVVRRADEARRLLLSDIGFTSMVPELSRSAEPVWAEKLIVGSNEATFDSHLTSKYLSRGSYRSPLLSVDKSNDWSPQFTCQAQRKGWSWRSSLPDVRRDDTDQLLEEADTFLRRSIDNLLSEVDASDDCDAAALGEPYIPSDPRCLRLGHTVKVISPHGRIAVGRVRYVGVAGGSAAAARVMVGVEVPRAPRGPRNDGTHRARRYFTAAPRTHAIFVPFAKVVMAWASR